MQGQQTTDRVTFNQFARDHEAMANILIENEMMAGILLEMLLYILRYCDAYGCDVSDLDGEAFMTVLAGNATITMNVRRKEEI